MTVTANKTKAVIGEVRFSYVHVFAPHAMAEGQEPKYSASILIPKSNKAAIEKVKSAIEAAKELGKTSKFGGKIPANLKTPLRDGDEERPDDPTYAGHFFINASSKQKPGVVDSQVQEIIDSSEFYSGCFGRVSINFYPFAVSGNKGIAAGLNNVQKLRDGDYLGGRAKAEDDFKAVEETGSGLLD